MEHNNLPQETPAGAHENEPTETPSSPSSGLEEDDFKKNDPSSSAEKKTGRRKINIEFIEDKSRRHITFSKRKAGIMKKAYELSTLTGTQVLLLVASETGHVYTFATPKLQPLITKPEGKNLIQSCLNASDAPPVPAAHAAPRLQGYPNDPSMMYPPSDMREPPIEGVYEDDKKEPKGYANMGGMDMNYPAGYGSSSMMNPYMVNPNVRYPATTPQLYAAHAQYAQAAAVSNQYAQPPQYASSGYAPNNMHGLPAWPKNSPGMGMPMQMQNQAPPNQGSQTSSHSGMMQQQQQQQAQQQSQHASAKGFEQEHS